MALQDASNAQFVEQIVKAIKGIRYGGVQITIHDGKVVRLERVERIRLTDPSETVSNLSG